MYLLYFYFDEGTGFLVEADGEGYTWLLFYCFLFKFGGVARFGFGLFGLCKDRCWGWLWQINGFKGVLNLFGFWIGIRKMYRPKFSCQN